MTLNTLGTPKPGNYDPSLVDRINKEAAEDAAQERNGTESAQSEPQDVPAEYIDFDRILGIYRFKNLPHSTSHAVELSHFLEHGAAKTCVEWQTWRASSDNWGFANTRVLYQCALRAYQLRDVYARDNSFEFACFLRGIFTPTRPKLNTSTRISYHSEAGEAHINHTSPFDPRPATINIPELETRMSDNWTYLVLANEQSQTELGKTNAIPEDAHPYLKALFGRGYSVAGAVWQYVSQSADRDGTLREVRLHAPTHSNRRMTVDHIVAIGSDNSEAVNIILDEDRWPRPALGIREVFA
ncbi:hypothetical protein HY642_03795 [Candidatus Woesearchaeota archaeon]|nr:hypothetical protein [Candidatus Woesearchaeota archaeon]